MRAAAVASAGYLPGEPVLVATQQASKSAEVLIRGTVPGDLLVTDSTRIYMASLSKQFVGACAALLVRTGHLDMEAALARWLPELPRWAGAVRLRHLLHHTAGLPADVHVDNMLGSCRDRTTSAVVAALGSVPSLQRPPGTAFEYSNAGYVCLALSAERAAGESLAAYARRQIFTPLGMDDTLFWPGPEPAPPAGLPLVPRHPAPLSLGDGGLWSTVSDVLRWSQAMNGDALNISPLLQTAGQLDDGRPLDYGWGVGVRVNAGHLVYRHGGGWSGLRLLHARVPDLQVSLMVVAFDDGTARYVALADDLLRQLCSPAANS